MICHIIGCGSTGGLYVPGENDYVIGVNDAGKFGYEFNELLFLNPPHHFNEFYGSDQKISISRLDVIRLTTCNNVVCLSTLVNQWLEYFKKVIPLPQLTRWTGKHFKPSEVYHTNTSPFTAMSYAVRLGFTNIVLWGVDFNNHKHLTAVDCVPKFSLYAQEVKRFDVRIFKGSSQSKLVLEVWKE